MACGLLAEDCIADHWCLPLGASREKAGWRAPCPLCATARCLSIQVKGRSPAWNVFCSCDRSEVRVKLAAVLPGCVSAKYRGTQHVDEALLLPLILDKTMPPNALRVGLLRSLGWSAARIRKELDLPRSTYYDTVRILGLNRRSGLVRILGLNTVRILGLNRRSTHS